MVYTDISHVNWTALAKPDGVLADINIEGSFLVPQLLAFVASQITPVKVAGKYSFTATFQDLKANAKAGTLSYPNGKSLTVQEVNGILKFLNSTPRGEVLGGAKQIDPKSARYATGVPLILSAFREYKDIQYSQWDWTDTENLDIFLDKDIIALVPYFSNPPDFTNEQLLEYRTIGGTYRTGEKVGQTKHLNSITVINKVGNPDFDGLPKLLRLMLCQTWVYQPHIRHKYSITNCRDIDSLGSDISGGIQIFDTPTVEVVDKWL